MGNFNFRRGWLNFLVAAQKRLLVVKKAGRIVLKNALVFLAPQYWLVYGLSFALGFYLWGPAHGIQKIRAWSNAGINRTEDKPTVETLQKELERLKRQLKMAEKPAPGTPFNPANFSRPAIGQIIQGFQWVANDRSWRLHPGVDIGIPEGSSVMAAAEGIVTAVSKTEKGYVVTLNHGNDWESVYGDLSAATVQEGQKLIKGVIVGTSGPAGCDTKQPAFHFGLYHEKQPVDPAKIIDGLDK